MLAPAKSAAVDPPDEEWVKRNMIPEKASQVSVSWGYPRKFSGSCWKNQLCVNKKQTFTQHIVSLFLASPMWRSANLPPERLQIPHETCRWRSHPEPQVEDQIIEIPQIFKLKVHRLCIEETPDFPLSKLYANARCALQMLKRGSSNPQKLRSRQNDKIVLQSSPVIYKHWYSGPV